MKKLKSVFLFFVLSASTLAHAEVEEKASKTWQQMSLIQLRMMEQDNITVNYEDYALDYLRYFDFEDDVPFKDLESEKNELKIYQQKGQLVEHLKQRVAAIDPEKTLVSFYVSRQDFEEYDFDKKGFPVELFNQYYGYEVEENRLLSRRDKGTFRYDAFAWFKNHEFPDLVPMDIDTASEFLDSLDKDSDGEYKRYFDMEVLAQPVEFSKDRHDKPFVKYEIVAFRVIGRTGDYRGKEITRVVNEEKMAEIIGADQEPEFDEEEVKNKLDI